MTRLQSTDFVSHLHDKFAIQLEGIEPIELELVEVTELGQALIADDRRPFSLIFLGPVSQQYLLQATYCLAHPQMGDLDIFIVPLGPQAGRMQYQAIFN